MQVRRKSVATMYEDLCNLENHARGLWFVAIASCQQTHSVTGRGPSRNNDNNNTSFAN
jgi:hypothetical protein